MRYPAFLSNSGTIGFIAPSFGCVTEPYHTAFEHALSRFQEMGFSTLPGPNCFSDCGIGISNTPEKCGAEINDFFTRKDCDVLISCGGGELMCEDLPYVDWEAIRRADPKWFMGFSDNTNLTFLLPTLCDTAAVYGPCAASFGMEPWHEAIEDAWEVLTGKKRTIRGYDRFEGPVPEESETENGEEPPEEDPLSPYAVNTDCIRRLYPEGDAAVSGRLIGGCLDCLAQFPGTPFDGVKKFSEKYKDDGILWFLEACDLNPMGVRRALWQLDQAGWFEHASGFLIGRPLHYGEEVLGLSQYDAVTGILKKYQVPIFLDLDIGHLPPMMPLLCGSLASARMAGNDFTITMELA